MPNLLPVIIGKTLVSSQKYSDLLFSVMRKRGGENYPVSLAAHTDTDGHSSGVFAETRLGAQFEHSELVVRNPRFTADLFPGGWRKKAKHQDPDLVADLEKAGGADHTRTPGNMFALAQDLGNKQIASVLQDYRADGGKSSREYSGPSFRWIRWLTSSDSRLPMGLPDIVTRECLAFTGSRDPNYSS
jgi:hypothetical protein